MAQSWLYVHLHRLLQGDAVDADLLGQIAQGIRHIAPALADLLAQGRFLPGRDADTGALGVEILGIGAGLDQRLLVEDRTGAALGLLVEQVAADTVDWCAALMGGPVAIHAEQAAVHEANVLRG